MLRLFLAAGFFLALATPPASAQRLSALAPAPRWTDLEAYQETITHDDFSHLLNDVYAPNGAAKGFVEILADCAIIKTALTPPATWTLHFAAEPGKQKPAPRPWRTPAALGAAAPDRPLQGLKIAIDPGHLGGTWARMEERFFQVGESKPVVEGDLTLRVSLFLEPRLKALGAEVYLIRRTSAPTTKEEPSTLREPARRELAREGILKPQELYRGYDDPHRGHTVQLESELLFYRISEIRARAALVNESIKPDLTLCLHLNAEAWDDPLHPTFVPRNHLHIIVNGCYSAAELRNDDVRCDMLLKLLTGCYPEELAISEVVAESMAKATKLPAYTYATPNAVSVGGNGYIWARNLLANRLYHTPVVFLEPYVMNSEVVWERVQAGDYEGEYTFAGEPRRSLFREYADAVTAGLKDYYTRTRPPQPAPTTSP